MDFSNDYIPVSLSVLKTGMEIDFSIYRENNREFSLLCKDVTLTGELIERFSKLTYPSYNIYIPSAEYEYVISGKPKKHVQNIQRNQVKIKKNAFFKNYEQVKENTGKIFDKIKFEDSVPAEAVNELTQTVHNQVETMEISHILQSINSVRRVDENLHTHCTNVALLNGVIGKWLKLDKTSLAALVKVGLLHDIGKLKIPQRILNKPERLTEDEFDLIMNHPIYSHELLIKSGYTEERILKGVIQHHERVNGLGYPFGLNINSITDFAKITSIADVYDAMVTKRAYKEAHSPFEILSWFADGCYSELDLNYVNVFLESMVNEFKGKKVMLSNGETATVLYINAMNFSFPVVQAGGEIIHTSADLRCISMLDE